MQVKNPPISELPDQPPQVVDTNKESSSMNGDNTTRVERSESKILHVLDRWGFSEGLVIGGVTGVGYFAAYLSDVGYKEYFGIPSMYADVSLNSVILSVSTIVFILFLLMLVVTQPVFRRYGTWILPVLLPLGVAAVIGQKIRYQFNLSWPFLVFSFAVTVLLTALLIRLVVRHHWFLAGLLLFFMVMVVSRASGYLIASNQSEYLVTTEPAPYVVVDTYRDALVLMPIDLRHRTVRREYRLVGQQVDMKDALPLKRMEIGPLRVKDN
jgi:hypothetical protein